jgi:uncharacterized protein (TIGR02271 family)
MPRRMTLQEILETKGHPLESKDGEKIGDIHEVYVDQQTNEPEWIGVGAGLLGRKEVLVPVEGTTFDGKTVHASYPQEKIKGAPEFDEENVSQDNERRLYQHYGLKYSSERSGTHVPGEGRGARRGRGEADEVTMTRSEEELRVGKRDVQAGTMRLRKYVETEPVSEDVELRRETVDVERRPVNEPARGGEIGEEEADMSLRREEAVADKEAVTKEEISARKRTETERETVSDELRKERIETDEDSDPGRGRR